MPGWVKCCKRKATREITYDCGSGEEKGIILCNYHYDLDPAFQRNIKKIKEIKN